jgi:hypothetical protein
LLLHPDIRPQSGAATRLRTPLTCALSGKPSRVGPWCSPSEWLRRPYEKWDATRTTRVPPRLFFMPQGRDGDQPTSLRCSRHD